MSNLIDQWVQLVQLVQSLQSFLPEALEYSTDFADGFN
jgi:hypothetical protein